MAFGAKLKFSGEPDEKAINLLNVSYSLYYSYVPHTAESVVGNVGGGEFNCTAYSAKESLPFSYLSNNKTFEGDITIGDAKVEGAFMRTITFKEAKVTYFSESFSENGILTVQFSFVADKVNIDQLPFDFVKQEASE